jgi:hypothetical protein
MSMTALPLSSPLPRRDRRGGGGAIAAGFGKSYSGSIFFEDIEKLHEFGRMSVFTNETP